MLLCLLHSQLQVDAQATTAARGTPACQRDSLKELKSLRLSCDVSGSQRPGLTHGAGRFCPRSVGEPYMSLRPLFVLQLRTDGLSSSHMLKPLILYVMCSCMFGHCCVVTQPQASAF